MSIKDDDLRRRRIASWTAHAEAERIGDLDALMATISQNPRWDVHPISRMEGHDSIREMYRRVIPEDAETLAETVKAINDPNVALWGEDHVVLHMNREPQTYPHHANMLLIVCYDPGGDLVQGERVFMTDPKIADAARKLTTDLGLDKIAGFNWY